MRLKKVRDLRAGDSIQLQSGECAVVVRCYREAIFEGDVWTVEHTQGQDTTDGSDKIAIGTA